MASSAISIADSLAIDGLYSSAIDAYTEAICLSDDRASSNAAEEPQASAITTEASNNGNHTDNLTLRFLALSHRSSAYLATNHHRAAFNDAKEALGLIDTNRYDFLSANAAASDNGKKLRYEQVAITHDRAAQSLLALNKKDGEVKIHWENALTLAAMGENESLVDRYQNCLEMLNDGDVNPAQTATQGKVTVDDSSVMKPTSHTISPVEEKRMRIEILGVLGTYVGETDSNGRPYGKGKMMWDDDEVYEGEWRNGKIEGRGTFRFANGDVYEGEWKNDMKEGRGTYRYADGDVYEGEWKNDMKEGRGTFRFVNGNVYEGEWKNNKKDGKGTFRWADGDVYEGQFKIDHMEGRGTYRFVNGGVYEGEFKNDKREGRGTTRFSNGDVYEGEYKNDMKEGRGTHRSANGDVYEGEWKNDMKEGRGTCRFVSGDVYEGELKNGKKEGKGTYQYAAGDVYEGKWKNDMKEGRGTYRFVNGDVYEGEWKNGEKHGKGRKKYDDGDVYDGLWEYGRPKWGNLDPYMSAKESTAVIQKACIGSTFRVGC